MKPLVNIAKHLDLRQPITQEQVERALSKTQREARPLKVIDILKAGYTIKVQRPTTIAAACAAVTRRRISVFPMFVKAGA